PKVEPMVSVVGVPGLTLITEPEPSISGWRLASATMANSAAGGALMTRSTLTTFPSMGDLLRVGAGGGWGVGPYTGGPYGWRVLDLLQPALLQVSHGPGPAGRAGDRSGDRVVSRAG